MWKKFKSLLGKNEKVDTHETWNSENSWKFDENFSSENSFYARMTTFPEKLLNDHPILKHTDLYQIHLVVPTLEELEKYDSVIFFFFISFFFFLNFFF